MAGDETDIARDLEKKGNVSTGQTMKNLIIVVSNFGRPTLDKLIKSEQEDLNPRSSLFERVLNSDTLDERMMSSASPIRKFFFKFLPSSVSKAIEAFLRKNQY